MRRTNNEPNFVVQEVQNGVITGREGKRLPSVYLLNGNSNGGGGGVRRPVSDTAIVFAHKASRARPLLFAGPGPAEGGDPFAHILFVRHLNEGKYQL